MADLNAEWEKAAPVADELVKAWDEADPKEKKNIYSKAKLYFSAYGRPMVEMGGMVAGGIAGSGVAPVAGTVAGAGLGLGIARKGADIIESGLGALAGEEQQSRGVGEELLRSAGDVAEGATYEMGGQLFMPVLRGGKWVFEEGKCLFAKQVNARIKSKAADLWVANTSSGPIYAKNAQEAADIEMSIPGLKFTYGQRTYDPNAIRLERAQIRKAGNAQEGNAAQMSAEQIASNDEALKAYYQSKFGSQSGVDDLLSSLQGKQQALEQNVEGAKQAAGAIESGMAQTKGPQELGGRLLNVLKSEKSHTRKAVSDLYDAIPNVEVPITGMIDELKAIAKPTSQVESSANFPGILKRTLKEHGAQEMPQELKNIVDAYAKNGAEMPSQIQAEIAKFSPKESLPFQELRGIRTEILNEMRSEAAKNNPTKMKRLGEMQQVIERAINQLDDANKFGEDISTLYRVASKKWKEYADTFKRYNVGNILQGGAKGEVSKMTPEQMLSSIFDAKNVSAADQLLNAVGEKEAVPLVKEYATYDMMKRSVNPMTGEVDRGKLMGWLNRNKSVLKKYGLEGEYGDLAQAKAAVDEAMKAKVAFEKSQAAKVLGADPEKAIATLFSGKGATNSAQTAKDILELVSGNRAATEGVKQAFGDFATQKISVSMRDIVGNPTASVAKFDALWQKFAPAMMVLYRDTPEKIKALMYMKKAYEIMIRNQRSPFGGGSDTAENLIQTIATSVSPIARTSRTATALKNIAGKIAQFEAGLVDKVINQAIFNPEYAETLKMLASPSQKLASIGEKRFAEHIAAATAMGSYSILEQE